MWIQVDSDSEADVSQQKQSKMMVPQPSPQSEGASPEGEDSFDAQACLNRGHPIVVEWDGRERDFIDGFGLCSPTCWHPASRGVRRTEKMQKLASETFEMLLDTVNKYIPDVRAEAFRLATGKVSESPFPPLALDALRKRWASLLPDPQLAVQIAEGQPFLLHGLAQWLEIFEDPEVGSLVDTRDSFATGVPGGGAEAFA